MRSIEKKPFFHAYPGALAYSFGMLGCRSALFILLRIGYLASARVISRHFVAAPGLA